MADLKYYRNNGLFSDYYLEQIPTKYQAQWDAAGGVGLWFTQAKNALNQIQALYQQINPASLNEAQLEEQWIKPIFDILGFHYGVQISIRYRDNGRRVPDYLLVATQEEANAFTKQSYTPDQLDHALAIADAKQWGINLDQSAKGERNPSQQIDEYLRYSELSWGILTDGRYWRLYHQDTSKYNNYYLFDLGELLKDISSKAAFQGVEQSGTEDIPTIEAFMYFYVFFRQQTFTTQWIDEVLKQSLTSAQELSETLEDEVYDALELIAQGFLEYRRNHFTPDKPTLDQIYGQSLILLYRLLFVFYAESREILPIRESLTYRNRYSLESIKELVKNKSDTSEVQLRDTSEIYNRLQDLFYFIDVGNDSLKMPRYNGKLFSVEAHPFLALHRVGDYYMFQALDKLARVNVKSSNKREFVDYRDLSVRHLGSIYEKLLEYELQIATEPLADKGGKYVPTVDPAKALIKPGQVYLRTDNNERKVTGSHYTPDYIVRFIVEKTIEPLLLEITHRHATLDADGHWQVHDPQALKNEILGINVLDPATGSGHFIVDATAYIAEWLTGLALNIDDLGDEDELIYWKRQVAGSCIYAVDINPLAVELAKLSMWLSTLAQGRPLSFLNHHLRAGNSLVGASLFAITDELTPKITDSTLPNLTTDRQFAEHVGRAVHHMDTIETTIPNHIEAVKQQEQLYAQLSQQLYAWRDVADVWTARDFGLALTADEWKIIRSREVSPKVQQIIEKAQKMAEQHQFFYWELAFPEVFFEADGTPKPEAGFDAVIGNPPYVRQERIISIKPYLERHYQVYTGKADLFLYFYEKGLEFLKQGGRLGYITSGTYMNSDSARPFRQYIHKHAGFEYVANFGENQPFRNAEMVFPTIAVLRRGEKRDTFKHLFMEGTIPFDQLPETLLDPAWDDSLSAVTSMAEWRFQPAELTNLFKKLTEGYQTLDQAVDGRIYAGIKTGFNDAFLIDGKTRAKLINQNTNSAEIIYPVLRGKDLRPWSQNKNDLYIIDGRTNIDIERYPAVYQHLVQFKTELEPRPANHTGKWDGRAAGGYKWNEYQGSPSYIDTFNDGKICWPDIAKLPRFSWNEGSYLINTGFMIPNAKFSLLGVLQSRVIWFVLSQLATPLRLRGGLWQYRVIVQYVERLPIPDLTSDQERDLSQIAEQITQLARERYQVHEDFRQTIINEFKGKEISTRVGLYKWWEFENEGALSVEIRRQLGQEIPLSKRKQWRDYLANEQARHHDLTAQIVTLETRMNELVYDAFHLTAEERVLIEKATKYPYGEV
jgi:type I restriction-modification system DNA methylase subunit